MKNGNVEIKTRVKRRRLVKKIGEKKVMVCIKKGECFTINVAFEEVVEFLQRAGYRFVAENNVIKFDSKWVFEKVLMYLLARKYGMSHGNAIMFALGITTKPIGVIINILVDTLLLYYLRHCDIKEYMRVLKAFAKIVETYQKISPTPSTTTSN